jgi:hypothetical protein
MPSGLWAKFEIGLTVPLARPLSKEISCYESPTVPGRVQGD